jgi:hypothetical protein
MRPAIVTSLLCASLAGCSRDRPTDQAVERSSRTSSLLDARRDPWLQPDRLLARVGIRRDATVARATVSPATVPVKMYAFLDLPP